MTNKELQKLGRRELLQLLLDQAKEADRLGKMLKENDEHLKQLEESYERLRDRLDKKDAQIHELKDALQAERDKREADLTARLAGGPAPAQQVTGPYTHRAQGYGPAPGGPAAPAPGAGGGQPGFPAQPPYQPAADPRAGQYQPPADPFPYQSPAQADAYPYQPQADPFPYQAPPQAPDLYGYQGQPQQMDPFPYQIPYQEGTAPAAYPPGMEQMYQYPVPQPERRQQGRLPFRRKKDQESGKTTFFFGW